MVNNLQNSWALIKLSSTEHILAGDRLTFISGKDIYISTVRRVEESSRLVVVEFGQYINGSTEQRRQQWRWQRAGRQRGVVFPREAIFAQGEEIGVFVVENSVINFRRVRVLDQNETLACVDNVPAGRLVVTNPRQGLHGIAANTD
jgi:hypothetical protein